MIEPPIILLDRDGCVYFFDSPDEAAGNIDVDDVLANEYVAYDSQGRALAVRPPTEPGFGGRIEPLEAIPTHTEQLRAALVQALNAPLETAPTYADQLRAALARVLRPKPVGISPVADDAPLPELLEEALRRKRGYHLP